MRECASVPWAPVSSGAAYWVECVWAKSTGYPRIAKRGASRRTAGIFQNSSKNPYLLYYGFTRNQLTGNSVENKMLSRNEHK